MTCAAAIAVNTYDIGDPVELSAAFTLSDGSGYDPTVVRLRIFDPLKAITVYVYGTDAELIRDDEGEYSAIIRPNVAGKFTYRYEAEDTGSDARFGAEERQFIVRRSVFFAGDGDALSGTGSTGGFDGGTP